MHEGQFRVIYIAKLADAVYVLHAFQKKTQAAEVLHITQPRVSALLNGKISVFRLDSLVDMAHRLGMHVSISVSA